MKKLEFIERILLDAANDMLQNLSMAGTIGGVTMSEAP